ncbi:MAG: hypothetical protein OEY67_08225 [Gammaproteobacteria bacterium]|nr:hypothetical protein [Gammaproteobacteria bacterium]
MTFLELLIQLEHRLGYHQLPINVNAKDIRDIFDSSPVHGTLAVRVVREIYKINTCQKTADVVDYNKTNNALIPIRLDILRSQKTDVDAFVFMDDLCHAVKEILTHKEGNSTDADSQEKNTGTGNLAKVIEFRRYRHRLKSWA